MADELFPPLAFNVPIVDADGKPTLVFQRFLQQIALGENLAVSGGKLNTSNVLTYTPGALGDPTYWNVPIDHGVLFTATNGSFLEFEGGGGANERAFWAANDSNFDVYWGFGAAKASGRYTIEGDQAFEFSETPYVVTDKIYHEGNLSFGAGLTYAAGVLSASGGGGGGTVLVEQHAGAVSASLDFTTGITATYDEYLIEFVNVMPATNNVRPWIRMSTNGGASYDATALYSDYFHSRNRFSFTGNGSEVDTKIVTMGVDHDNAHSIGINGYIRLFSPLSTTLFKAVLGEFTINNGAGFVENCQFSGWYRNLAAVNAIQFLMSAGNITSGSIRMYGIAK